MCFFVLIVVCRVLYVVVYVFVDARCLLLVWCVLTAVCCYLLRVVSCVLCVLVDCCLVVVC